jgi:hypothetical protein
MEQIEITIAGQKHTAQLRTFKSGKTGYGLYGKINIDGKQHQMSINIIKLG